MRMLVGLLVVNGFESDYADDCIHLLQVCCYKCAAGSLSNPGKYVGKCNLPVTWPIKKQKILKLNESWIVTNSFL